MRGANSIWRVLWSLLCAHWRGFGFISLNIGATTIVIALKFHSQGAYDAHSEAEPISWRTINTEFGSPGPVTLEDGSVLRPGPNTQVQIGFASDRLVRGQADFKVAQNSKRPFDVLAAGTTVRAIGTEFSVRVRTEYRVLVRVTEGSVQVTSSAQTEIKSPFHLDTAQLRAGDIAVSDSRGIAVAAQGWLTFYDERLTDAVEQVNRFGWARFDVADQRIAQRGIAGPVRISEPDSFVPLLQVYHIASKALGQSPDGSPRFQLRASRQPDEHLD
jgi:transmembrane sensor